MASSQDSIQAAEPRDGLVAPPADPWEAAYLRFETPDQEIQKFLTRLQRLGAADWPKKTSIVELFCGRGNGMRAWERLGFHNVEGVDLSPRLIAQYNGPFPCHVADCRELPFASGSKDAAVVQGGLHHLAQLPEDLDRTLGEIRRVLRSEGRVLFVEPWRTPFLMFIHFVAEKRIVRRLSTKVDALSTMIHYERQTYERWLDQPELILSVARRHFVTLRESFAWGKWSFVGEPRP